MIISFGVLLLFAQDMREWIHNFQKRILKKGTFTYTHTHTHSQMCIHSLSQHVMFHFNHHTHSPVGGHIQCAVQVFLGVYTQSPTLLAYCEFKVN